MSENKVEEAGNQPQTQETIEVKAETVPQSTSKKNRDTVKDPVQWNAKSGLVLRDTADLQTFAEMVLKSDLAPNGLDSVQKICIALQHGAELGFSHSQSVQSIHVINGKPGLDVKAQLALIRSKGLLETFEDIEEGDITDGTYKVTVITTRSDKKSMVKTSFSVDDAKRAGLWDERERITRYNKSTKKEYTIPNPAPWYCYPKNQIWCRAVGQNLGRNFSDVLKGLVHSKEELSDFNRNFETMKRAEKGEEVVKKGNLKFNDEE